MHADVRPYYPPGSTNGLLHAVSIDALYLACISPGLLGVFFVPDSEPSTSKGGKLR